MIKKTNNPKLLEFYNYLINSSERLFLDLRRNFIGGRQDRPFLTHVFLRWSSHLSAATPVLPALGSPVSAALSLPGAHFIILCILI